MLKTFNTHKCTDLRLRPGVWVRRGGADAFGNALGSSVVDQFSQGSDQQQRLAENRTLLNQASQQSDASYYGPSYDMGSGGGLKWGTGGPGFQITADSSSAFSARVQNGIDDRVWRMQEADNYDKGLYVPGGGQVGNELPGRSTNSFLLASNAQHSPMSLRNPDTSTLGGWLGSAASSAWNALVEGGQFMLEGAANFNNVERMGRTPNVSPSSSLGQLLADGNLTIGDKAKILAIGTLHTAGQALLGDPEAIGPLLAGWGTGKILASPGTRVAAAVDELATTSGRFADRVMGSVSRESAVDLAYSSLRTSRGAPVELQVAAEANALALADRLGSFTRGDILEIQAYRSAVRNGDTVLIEGRRLDMLQNATEGVSRQGGLDMPVLRTVDGRSQLVIGEMKNYSGEASSFSAVTRNFDLNLRRLEQQVRSDAFNLPESTTRSLLNDIRDRNLTVEIYGNRTTTMNNLPQLTNQIRASTTNGSNINTTFRRVPW